MDAEKRRQDFLAKARQADEQAEKSKDESARTAWRDIAKSYRSWRAVRARQKFRGLYHSGMPQASLEALLVAYHEQAKWLIAQAVEFETGARKVTGQMRGQQIDLSPNTAAEYRHKAGNLMAIIQAYERLHSKGV